MTPRPDAKLTGSEVLAIRAAVAARVTTLAKIAAAFGVSRALVAQIRDRRIWKWL